MAQSFQINPGKAAVHVEGKRRVLITGAAGNIGSFFAEYAHTRYELRLMVRNPDKAREKGLGKFGEVVQADLGQLEHLKEAFRGIDTVVHLAGEPYAGAAWNDLLEANIIGTYHVFAAACAAGCRRVIFASSIHAISGYPPDVQVKSGDPVNPGDLYGVSKCFGEALARYMAAQEGLSAIALRIGAFQSREAAKQEEGLWMFDAWVSRRDLSQLITRCIDAPDTLRFAIFAGLSDNRFKRMDITDARELLGYAPEDDLTEINPGTRPLNLDKVPAHSLSDGENPSGLREEL